MLDFLRFYIEAPALAYNKYSSPVTNLLFLLICTFLVIVSILFVSTKDTTVIEGLFDTIRFKQMNDKKFTIFILTLLGIILALLIYGEYKKMPIVNIFKTIRTGKIHYYNRQGYGDLEMKPEYDIATPSDIITSLREDDMNTLMFGRSDALSENSNGGEILRGYENSSEMGDQYGTFTGMTLYSGPEMFEQRDIHRVWKDLENIDGPEKRKMSPELVLLRNEYIAVNEKIRNTSNVYAKAGLISEEKVIKEKIYEQLLKESNNVKGIKSDVE